MKLHYRIKLELEQQYILVGLAEYCWFCRVRDSLVEQKHMVNFGALLGAYFYRTRYIWPQCTVRQYHSDLSDQSALQIRVSIRVRLKVALFQHYSRRIKKMSTFSSRI